MRTTGWTITLLVAALVSGCSGQNVKAMTNSAAQEPARDGAEDDGDDDGDDGEEEEEDVALADVPANVKKAAEAAVPGIVLKSAERETEDGVSLYSLAGTVAGEAVEIEVSVDGKVLEIERGEDDDDGEDDD